jgi:radical SAM protein with 4Fe4S-binding SPASM domain
LNFFKKRYYRLIYGSLTAFFRTPPYLILFLSSKCPNNCLHCWYNGNWKINHQENNELTFEEIEKLTESISFIEFLSLTGGEAFLRNDLADIIYCFSKNTNVRRIDIPTSGFNPGKISSSVIDILKQINGKPFRVDVSIDAVGEVHNIIRKNDNAFENAQATIYALKDIKKTFKNLEISIITTISNHNCNFIDEIAEFTNNILPEGVWFVNIARPPYKNVIINNECINSYEKALEFIKARSVNGQFRDNNRFTSKILRAKNSVRSEVIIKMLNNQMHYSGCGAGSLAGVIFNDGSVHPCESLDKSFGNLRDNDFDLRKIWNSKIAKEIRKMIQETSCSCTHECFLSVSIPVHPELMLKVAKRTITGN